MFADPQFKTRASGVSSSNASNATPATFCSGSVGRLNSSSLKSRYPAHQQSYMHFIIRLLHGKTQHIKTADHIGNGGGGMDSNFPTPRPPEGGV
jgi:hypothetical protein